CTPHEPDSDSRVDLDPRSTLSIDAMHTPTKTPPTAWTGYVPVEDTALRVTDTGGDGIPVVYLNGSYANTRHWKRVITELGFTGTVHAAPDQALAGHGLQRTPAASAGGS